jgi:hypothetical protein
MSALGTVSDETVVLRGHIGCVYAPLIGCRPKLPRPICRHVNIVNLESLDDLNFSGLLSFPLMLPDELKVAKPTADQRSMKSPSNPMHGA